MELRRSEMGRFRNTAPCWLDPRDFAGHSFHSGCITSAAKAGASLEAVMDPTGHESVQVARNYFRRVDAFAHHPGEGLL